MSIYVTDSDPKACAESLDDLTLSASILRIGAVLSCAIIHTDWVDTNEYNLHSTIRQDDPWIVWARKQRCNWVWLHKYYSDCVHERNYRKSPNPTPHLSYVSIGQSLADIRVRLGKQINALLEQKNPTEAGFPVVNSMCGRVPEIYGSYRMELIFKWVKGIGTENPPQWTKRQPPSWWRGFINGAKSKSSSS